MKNDPLPSCGTEVFFAIGQDQGIHGEFAGAKYQNKQRHQQEWKWVCAEKFSRFGKERGERLPISGDISYDHVYQQRYCDQPRCQPKNQKNASNSFQRSIEVGV